MTTPNFPVAYLFIFVALMASGCGVSDRMNSMDTQMQGISAQMKEINGQLKQTNQQLGTTNQQLGSMKEMNGSMNDMKFELKKTNENLSSMKSAVVVMGDGFKSVAADLQKLGISAQYIEAITKFAGEISGNLAKVGKLSDTAEAMMANTAQPAKAVASTTPPSTPPTITEDDAAAMMGFPKKNK